jgi:hypothetical protein
MDLFECARVDSKYPIEEIVGTLKALQDEGKFDHIGLSECSAETLRRAVKVVPIAAVEIEISPISYEEETKKGKRVGLSVDHVCSCLCSHRYGQRAGRCSRRVQPNGPWRAVAASDQTR